MNNVPFESILRRLATILSVVILTLSLIATASGILIAYYYEPAAGAAYESLQKISTEVSNGSLIVSLHDSAGNAVIIAALLQIVVMFLGRKFQRSWVVAWISGILFTLNAIALSWTAMILDWNQDGYWRLQIELGTIEAIPLIGPQLRDIITGGGAVGTPTIEHLYTIHSYILALSALILSLIHLGGLLLQEYQAKRVGETLEGLITTIAESDTEPAIK